MNLSNLQPAEGATHNQNKRLGRGEGSGKGGTAARGHKGAKSRSGYSKKIGFEGDDVHPCLYVCKSEKGIVFIAIYIYDNLLVGNEEAIDEVIKLLQREGFSLKIKDNLDNYLSCNVLFLKSGKEAWLG